MCIAVAKPKGIKRPSNEIFKECFDNNKDGAGFAFALDGRVVISKGYMTYDDYIKAIEDLEKNVNLEEIAMLYHFRIGTQGGNVGGNTHPFPLSSKVEELKAETLITDICMIHNGIISETSSYDYKKAFPELSDTQIFCSEFLEEIKTVYGIDKMFESKLVDKLIKTYKGTGKFGFLTNIGDIVMYGEWIEDGGVYYSNKTYKESKWLNVGGRQVAKGYASNYVGNSYYSKYGFYDEIDLDYFEKRTGVTTNNIDNTPVVTQQVITEITKEDEEFFNQQSESITEIDSLLEYEFYDEDLIQVPLKDLKAYNKLYIDELGFCYVKDDLGFLEVNLVAYKVR